MSFRESVTPPEPARKHAIIKRRGSLPLTTESRLTETRRSSLRETVLWMIHNKLSSSSGQVLSRAEDILSHPDQGMIPEHFENIRQVSQLRMQAIFVRKSNPENLELIPLNFPSKNTFLKPKTSDWNFSIGFLPENPVFSKLVSNPELIDDMRQVIKELYDKHPLQVVGQQLSLTEPRIKRLLYMADSHEYLSENKIMATFHQNDVQVTQIVMKETSSSQWSLYNEDMTPFNVLAHPKYGPYIADYDLLMEASPYSHHLTLSNSYYEYSVGITKRQLFPMLIRHR